MRNGLVLVLIILAASLMGETVPREMIFRTSQPVRVTRGEVGLPAFDSFLTAHQVREIKPITPKDDNCYFVARFDQELDWAAIESERPAFPGVDYIQPNHINHLYVTSPNDPYLANQQFDLVNLQEAWNLSTGSRQVIVALVDSGLLFDHPDLQTNIYHNPGEGDTSDGIDNDGNGYIDDIRGWDFVDAPELASIGLGDYTVPDNDPTDENNHGTHVGGIIAADANNAEGICGSNWQVSLLVIRAGFRTTESTGYLQDDDCAASIIYAADMGADVMNLSWGDTSYSQIIADACLYAYNRGCVIVASSGNTPEYGVSYPARLSTTIAVGAVDANLNLASFSCYGPEVDCVAPGFQVLSTYDDTPDYYYYEQSGTSMSAPFVSGAVALLLAHEPELTVPEVRARLASTCYDLGDDGFDNYFGYGLLDVYDLLAAMDQPRVQVTFPEDYSGYSSSFDILGSIQSSTFFRYTVMYSRESLPGQEDWYDVAEADLHVNTPTFYTTPVEDGVIARFNFSNLFPDGTYIIRVALTTTDGAQYDTRCTVYIDQSAPTLAVNKPASVMKRWDGEIPAYYLYTYFNEDVNLLADCIGSDDVTRTAASNYPDSVQVLRLPDDLPAGPLTVNLHTVNRCGIHGETVTLSNIATIERTAIDTDAYEETPIGSPLYGVSKPLLLSGSLVTESPEGREFVAMKVSNGYGPVSFYRLDDDQLVTTSTFTYSLNGQLQNRLFKPLDVGDTNGWGLEVLGLNLDKALLYETSGGAYPTQPVNQTAPLSDVLGGLLADYDQDGNDEIFLVESGTNSRVITLRERSGSTLAQLTNHTLTNPTPTSQRNNFVPSLILDDLDGDDYPDLLAADTDGDILVYEMHSTTDSLVWTYRLPAPNAYYMAVGHFTDRRSNQFVVGGYMSDVSDQNKSYWFFEFFHKTSDNHYAPYQYLAFDHVESENSIAAADLDNDGYDELVLALAPNLYIVDDSNDGMIPVWKGDSYKTYQALAFPKTDTKEMALLVNGNDGDSLRTFLVRPSEPFTGPATPRGLLASPLNANQVKLTWLASGAEAYCVYRKQGDRTVLLHADRPRRNAGRVSVERDSLATTSGTEFIDSGLTPGVEYQYCIKGVDNDFTPNLSRSTPWKAVTPDYPPALSSISLVNTNTLEVLFDRPLAPTAANLGNFQVNHEIGAPVSAVFTRSKTGLLLHFYGVFPEYDNYLLSITGLKGESGTPFPSGDYPFLFEADVTPPAVDRFEIVDKRTVNFYFTEDLVSSEAGNLANYMLTPPSADPTNTIASIAYQSAHLQLKLTEDLEYSNQPYYLALSNLHDLAGNALPNNGNLVRFYLTEISDLSHVQPAPNPLRLSKQNSVSFVNLPLGKRGSLRIYNLTGEQVFQGEIPALSQSENTYSWNACNSMLKPVSSGTYFYILKMGDDTKRGVIGIVR
jgi:subtilisin family serine protease